MARLELPCIKDFGGMIHIDLFAGQYAESLVRKREELARQTRWNLTKDRKTKTQKDKKTERQRPKKEFDIVISSPDVNLREAMGSLDSDTLDALLAHREEMRQQREVKVEFRKYCQRSVEEVF